MWRRSRGAWTAVLLATFQPSQIAKEATDIFEIEPHVFAGGKVLLQLDVAVGPVINLLGEAFVDRSEGLVHVGYAASRDFAEVLRDKSGGRECESPLFQPGGKPRRGERWGQERAIGRRERFEVQVRRPTSEGGAAIGQDADELQALEMT